MASLQQLCDRVLAFDFTRPTSPSTRRRAKEVCKDIDKFTESGEYRNSETVPPLCIHAFLLRCLIYPQLDLDGIPRILDLITNVEFYRLSKSETMSAIYTWGKFYSAKKKAPPVQSSQATQWDPSHNQYVLSQDDITYFEHVQNTLDDMKAIFFRIVYNLCIILHVVNQDILHLLQEHRDLDVPRRWKQCFSGKPAMSFHPILSEDEKQKLHHAMKDCQTIAYALMPLGDPSPKHADATLNNNTNDTPPTRFQDELGNDDSVIRKKFPELLDLGSLVALIEYHINFVEELVDRVDEANVAFIHRDSQGD